MQFLPNFPTTPVFSLGRLGSDGSARTARLGWRGSDGAARTVRTVQLGRRLDGPAPMARLGRPGSDGLTRTVRLDSDGSA